MTAKHKFILIIIVLSLIFTAGVTIIIFIYSNNTSQNANNNTNKAVLNINKDNNNSHNNASNTNINGNDANNPEVTNTNSEPNIIISPEEEQKNIIKIAKDFTERFGTYSNQNQGNNLDAIEPYLSSSRIEWLNRLREKSQAESAKPYYSYTARVVSSELIEFDITNGKARVSCNTMRQEKKAYPSSERQYNQKINLQLVKENNSWKISDVNWL